MDCDRNKSWRLSSRQTRFHELLNSHMQTDFWRNMDKESNGSNKFPKLLSKKKKKKDFRKMHPRPPTHAKCKAQQMPQRCRGPRVFPTWLFTEEKLGDDGRTVIWSQGTSERLVTCRRASDPTLKAHAGCVAKTTCWARGLDFVTQFYGCSILFYSTNVYSPKTPTGFDTRFENR